MDMGPCPDGARFDPAVEIRAFLDEVERQAGCRPLLYVTPEFDRAYLAEGFGAEGFWVRSIMIPPQRRQDWLFWQYHNAGRRDGIEGPVDLNAYRGAAGEIDSLIAEAGCFAAVGQAKKS